MSFGKSLAFIGASFIGIIIGHSVMKAVLGNNRNRTYQS